MDCNSGSARVAFLAMIRIPRPLLALALAVGAASAIAVEPADPAGMQPLPGVVRCAEVQGIPVEGFELAGDRGLARPGDRLTVLFSVQDGPATRQWLAEFRAAAPTDREAKSKPGSGLGLLGLFHSSLKTDTGHEYSFPQSPAALELRTFGPFGGADAAGEVRARVLATREYLAQGLAPMAEIELRLRAAGKKNPGLSFLFRPRFSREQMAAATARARDAGFTEADERQYAEGFFALVQFASLAFRTPGIAAITREMLDSPTLFSGGFVNLVWPAMQLEPGSAWGLPGARIFRVPYNLHSRTEAKGSLFITAPRPPLQNTAGIIGLTIDWSSKTATRRLSMRVIAGRTGTP